MHDRHITRMRNTDQEFERLDALSKTRALTEAESDRLYQLVIRRTARIYAQQRQHRDAMHQYRRGA